MSAPPGQYGERSWRMFWWRLPLVLSLYIEWRVYRRGWHGITWLFAMLR